MKTGLTVDFRNREILRDEEEEGAIPLFYSQHIKQGKVEFPIQKEHEYVVTEQKGLMQDNKNYLFVKRFTAKEEPRRLQCGVYLAQKFPQYQKISTQNKINFVDGVLTEMSECLVYGLYVLFNSTIYDEEVNKVLYESKLIGYPKPWKNKVRTFCQNPGGFLAQLKASTSE